jgi:uncharacterized protein (UPF0332 family)
MIERFKYYMDEGLVKAVRPNKENAKALMNRAYERLEYVRNQKITSFTATFIFEDVYESLREGAQALMELKGYKPYSHEAIISFLRDNYKFQQKFLSAFDRYRILRNKCLYGAAQLSAETCKEALGFLAGFLPELRKELEEGP